jgi:hypothetical protein
MRVPITKCQTPACSSTEAEAASIGPPETVNRDFCRFSMRDIAPSAMCPYQVCFLRAENESFGRLERTSTAHKGGSRHVTAVRNDCLSRNHEKARHEVQPRL